MFLISNWDRKFHFNLMKVCFRQSGWAKHRKENDISLHEIGVLELVSQVIQVITRKPHREIAK